MNTTEYNVIVIGAGMAGLTAAEHLAVLGHRVLIIEAKNRVGGRIHTLKTQAGYPIEMGAYMLKNPGTSEKPNPLVPLLDQVALTTTPIEPIYSTQFNAGDYFENATRRINEAKEFPWKTWPSLEEVLKIHPLKLRNKLKLNSTDFIGRQTLTHMIKQQTGSMPRAVSLLALMHFDQDPAEYLPEAFISGGYQNLPEDMAKRLIATGNVNVLINTPIAAIHYLPKNDTLQVVAINGKQYTAQRVLCTVPLGILKKQSIHFEPALSLAKQQLIKNLNVGFHNKVILEFEKVFWEKDAHFLFPGTKDFQHFPEYFNLFHFSNHKTPALACHFYASEACFKTRSDDQMIEKALLPLRHTYGKIAATLKDAFVTHWDSDPYALGSTSCYGLKSEVNELNKFREPEPSGLFFAGAHTLNNQNRETVQGAYISGIRAALDINHNLKSTFKPKRKH